jgi:hypothetical protein
MKESSSDSTRAIYDVVLLHPMENQNPYACYFSTPRSQEDIVAEWYAPSNTTHTRVSSCVRRVCASCVVCHGSCVMSQLLSDGVYGACAIRAKTSHYLLGSHQQRLAHELVVQWKTTPKGVTAGV